MTLSSHVFRQLEELDRLAPDWWKLWERSPASTPFQTPAWLIPWWRAFAPGSLYVMAVRDRDRLVGLAPCYIEDGSRRLLPIGIGTSDYLDILLDRSAELAGRAVLALFEDAPAARLEFADAPADAAIAGLAAATVTPAVELCPSSICPVLDLRDGAASVPPSQRRNLAGARNRADRRGGYDIQRVAGNGGFVDVLIAQHSRAWRRRDEAGIYADARVRAHHSAALPLLAERDLLRAYLLTIGSEIAAAYLGFHWRDRAAAYVTGYDPSFSFESPGTLVMGHAIAEALDEGAAEFHFLRGQEAYKYRWGARDRRNLELRFIRMRAAAHAN